VVSQSYFPFRGQKHAGLLKKTNPSKGPRQLEVEKYQSYAIYPEWKAAQQLLDKQEAL
jgi:hypothetical protein